MPRSARLDIPGLLQHVIVRGVARCDIFRDDDDRERFLQTLSTLLVETDTDCLAWSLMTNHVHLLLRPRQSRLAPFMRSLLTGYAIYFNLRHKRSGHLFQNRYKSVVCEEDAYLLELVRYIHLNPLRAGLVQNLDALDRYPWSGHAVVMGRGALAGQGTDEILMLFAKGKREARKRYRQYVADGVALGKREELGGNRKRAGASIEGPDEETFDARILGSGGFIDELRGRQDLRPKLPLAARLDDIVVRSCQYFGIEQKDLRLQSRAARIAEARAVICYLAVRVAGHSGAEVGRQVNLRRAGVCVAARRGAQLVQDTPSLLELVNK